MKTPMSQKEAYSIATDFLNKVWFFPSYPESPFELHSYPIIGERYNGVPIHAYLNLKLNRDKLNPNDGEIVITTQDLVLQNCLYDGFFLSFVKKPCKTKLAEHIKGICNRYNFTLMEKL